MQTRGRLSAREPVAWPTDLTGPTQAPGERLRNRLSRGFWCAPRLYGDPASGHNVEECSATPKFPPSPPPEGSNAIGFTLPSQGPNHGWRSDWAAAALPVVLGAAVVLRSLPSQPGHGPAMPSRWTSAATSCRSSRRPACSATDPTPRGGRPDLRLDVKEVHRVSERAGHRGR